MKMLILLGLFSSLSVLGQESCERWSRGLCAEVDREYDYNFFFHQAADAAFKEALGDSSMKGLICRNFVRRSGSLTPNLSFERGCWPFYLYRRILNKHKIKRCDDFKKFGADDNFLLNCHDVMNMKLAGKVPKGSGLRLQAVIRKVKKGIAESFEGHPAHRLVQRSLDGIIDLTHVNRKLNRLDVELIRPEELCLKDYQQTICTIYRGSNKKVVSVGGNIFLSDHTLETVVAKKIAEHVAGSVHSYFYDERYLTYKRFLREKMSRWRFENILANLDGKDTLNLSTNAILILRKYFETQKILEPEIFKIKAGYFCYQDPSGPVQDDIFSDKPSFYEKRFTRLHRLDQVEAISCEEEPDTPRAFVLHGPSSKKTSI